MTDHTRPFLAATAENILKRHLPGTKYMLAKTLLPVDLALTNGDAHKAYSCRYCREHSQYLSSIKYMLAKIWLPIDLAHINDGVFMTSYCHNCRDNSQLFSSTTVNTCWKKILLTSDLQ
jgi:hypothetical protein